MKGALQQEPPDIFSKITWYIIQGLILFLLIMAVLRVVTVELESYRQSAPIHKAPSPPPETQKPKSINTT